MAKKKSLYEEIAADELKIQLKQTIEHLENINPQKMEDRIGERYSNGNVLPYVVSTIEDQIRAALTAVKASAGYIIAIYNKQGLDEDLVNDIEVTVSKLEEIKEFYDNIRIESITDRKLYLLVGYKGRGRERVGVMSYVVVSTREKQIETRIRFVEEILKIKPQIDIINSFKNKTTRGGGVMVESIQRFIERRNAINTEQSNIED